LRSQIDSFIVWFPQKKLVLSRQCLRRTTR